ncbi:MAG: glycoside hydrolase family 16 protein, partial [Bacteroidetes bacterium]|nr:glycoside hydrolase family 16 protein [Bacteroidota bacterium]
MLQTRVPGVSRVIILSVFFLLFLQPFLSAQCYELVWAEEFNYTGLPDPNIWTHEVGGGGWGNNELQYYTDRDTDNAWVEDGTLLINALKENFGGRSYTSARLVSKGKGEFKYGKIEARLKLPYGQGMWAAFWMLGTNFSDVGWPASGEIDIMEMVGGGTGDKTTHGTVHWEDNGHASYGGSKTLSSGIFADTFHVFSVEWTSQKISWLLDGVQFHVVDIRPSGLSEFHQEFFIILNLAVGGNWPGSPDGTTVFPQHFEVDYVRVYQAGESLKITGDQVAAIRQKNLNFS